MKKRALICLFGLPRTFKQTVDNLFSHLIYPNSDKYDFDIIINTDFEGTGLTYGRPDTAAHGKSIYNYETVDQLEADLKTAYNRTNRLKFIQFYNFKRKTPIYPIYVVYKRIHISLAEVYKQNPAPYDMYITHRIDTLFTGKIQLEGFENKFTFVTNELERPGFLHNRDLLDFTIISAYTPFMMYMNAVIVACIETSKFTKNYTTLFDFDGFCDDNLVKDVIQHREITVDNNEILHKIKLHHSAKPFYDRVFNQNNTPVFVDILSIDGVSVGSHILNILCNVFHLITQTHTLQLGHDLTEPVNVSILR